jgi:mercuric ion transport protein
MDRSFFEKFGTIGAVVAAAACPICFPKVALVGAAIGFGTLAPFEGYIAVGVQVLFVLALVGQALAFPRHRNRWLLALSVVTTVLLFVAYYVFPSSTLLQVSLAGLVAASIWLVVESRRCATCEAQARGVKADA